MNVISNEKAVSMKCILSWLLALTLLVFMTVSPVKADWQISYEGQGTKSPAFNNNTSWNWPSAPPRIFDTGNRGGDNSRSTSGTITIVCTWVTPYGANTNPPSRLYLKVLSTANAGFITSHNSGASFSYNLDNGFSAPPIYSVVMEDNPGVGYRDHYKAVSQNSCVIGPFDTSEGTRNSQGQLEIRVPITGLSAQATSSGAGGLYVYIDVSAQPAFFSVDASVPLLNVVKSEPAYKELNAYANFGFRNTPIDEPLQPFLQGVGTYSIWAQVASGALFNPARYQWSATGADVEPVLPSGWRTGAQSQSIFFNFGDVSWGTVTHSASTAAAQLRSMMPRSTTVYAAITGETDDTSTLAGRVKVNWQLPPNLYCFTVDMGLVTGDDGSEPGADEWAQITQIQQSYKNTQNLGASLVGSGFQLLYVMPAQGLMGAGLVGVIRAEATAAGAALDAQKAVAALRGAINSAFTTRNIVRGAAVVTVGAALASDLSPPNPNAVTDYTDTFRPSPVLPPITFPTTTPTTSPVNPPLPSPTTVPTQAPSPPPTTPPSPTLVPVPVPTSVNPTPSPTTTPVPLPSPAPSPTTTPVTPTPTSTPQPIEYVVDSNVFMEGRTAILPYLNDPNVVIHLPQAAYDEVEPFATNIYRPIFTGNAIVTYLLANGTVTKAPIVLHSDPNMTGIDLRSVSNGGLISGNFGVADAKIVQTAKELGMVLLSHNAAKLNNQINSSNPPGRKVLWGSVVIRQP